MPREDCMRELRDRYHVPDELIGRIYGISRQRVHALLGPRPPEPAHMPLPPLPAAVTDDAFQAYVKAFRARHDLSQTELGRLLGVDQTAISRWERTGICNLAGPVMALLSRLDREIEDLTKKQ